MPHECGGGTPALGQRIRALGMSCKSICMSGCNVPSFWRRLPEEDGNKDFVDGYVNRVRMVGTVERELPRRASSVPGHSE